MKCILRLALIFGVAVLEMNADAAYYYNPTKDYEGNANYASTTNYTYFVDFTYYHPCDYPGSEVYTPDFGQYDVLPTLYIIKIKTIDMNLAKKIVHLFRYFPDQINDILGPGAFKEPTEVVTCPDNVQTLQVIFDSILFATGDPCYYE